MAKILITGGAGFIGSHLARALLSRGDDVRVLDCLVEQVHGISGVRRLDGVDLVVGDVRDEAALGRALDGVDDVVHLAAEVGVGQSMYAVERYVSANDLGTAALFQKLIERPVRRVVTASSMSIYGEGLYRNEDGHAVEDAVADGAGAKGWDPLDAEGRPLAPMPTPETKRPDLASVYALTKFVQERLTLTVAAAYGMEGVALRLFNVYGPGQALSNPYTGVLAIFASRLLNGRAPLIFQDGRQRRDFVHVSDVVAGFLAALDSPKAVGQVFNIGSGRERTVLDVAEVLAKAVGREDIAPEVTGKHRTGDIRNCFADISRARAELGYAPQMSFERGIAELAGWLAEQSATDRAEEARRELEARGLVA